MKQSLEQREAGRALKSEARAWRAGARMLASERHNLPSLTTVCAECGGYKRDETHPMRRRMIEHYELVDKTSDYPAPWSPEGRGARVLACLFLALECEDEAKSLSGEDEASASLGMKKV